MQSAFKKFQKKAAPILEAFKHHSIKAGSAGLEASKQAGLAVKTTVAPAATAMLQKGAENASALRKNLADKKKTGKAPVVEIILPKAKQQALSEASETVASIIPADELALSSAQEPTIENTSSTPKIQVSATGLLTSFREWLKDPKHKKVAILGLAVFLLAFSGLTAYIRRQPDTLTPASSQNEEQLTKAQNLYDQAVTARELKQNVEAARHIQDGQQIVNSLTNLNETQKRQAEDIWNKLTTEGDTLTSTTRFAASAGTFSLGKTGQRMFANLPYFFSTLSTPSSSLLRSGKGDPSSTKGTIELPDKDDAIVSIAKSSESDTTGYVLTRNNKVYRIVQSGTDTLLRPITPASGTIAPGDDIATYIGNVYVLDGKTGLLWKYTNTGTAYSKGTSVIDGTKYDIKKSLSLAIDGSIYILKQDATVQKFTGGAQDSFSLKGIPAPGETIVQPLQIVTNEDMNSIYVLDGGLTSGSHSTARILEFDKSGNYVSQFAFPGEYLQVRSFDIDPDAKKVWILNGSDISEFDIP
ncbi:MAG: hypothetical protein K0S20_697 [Patescibacteria group bacterium]|nr:hypothetical protein [Patescibacteria group bacterium]